MARDEKYDEYLESSRWQEIRKKALHTAGYRCQVCGNTRDLQVHHDHYWTFGGNEEPGRDVIVLCRRCHALRHEALDKERAEQRQARMDRHAHYHRAVDRWRQWGLVLAWDALRANEPHGLLWNEWASLVTAIKHPHPAAEFYDYAEGRDERLSRGPMQQLVTHGFVEKRWRRGVQAWHVTEDGRLWRSLVEDGEQ